MAAYQEKYVQLTHGKTRYWEAGSTGTPTILIHGAGWTSGCETWVLNIGPLSEKLHVYALDCLNWGLGDVFDQEFSFAYLVDHVREFMDALGIEKANIVGHSMGGWIGTLLAYESPERVLKFVNVAGGGVATRPLASMVGFKQPSDDDVRKQLSHRYAEGRADVEALAASFIKKGTLAGHAEAFGKVMKHMTEPNTRTRYNTLRRMPHIKAPTLVLWGDADEVNALEMGEQTAKAIPGARLEVFPGIGHMLPQQAPDHFNELVAAFFAG